MARDLRIALGFGGRNAGTERHELLPDVRETAEAKRGREMSEIENPTRVTSHEAIIDIFEQIQLLHKRIDDLKEEFSMLRAGKGEK